MIQAKFSLKESHLEFIKHGSSLIRVANMNQLKRGMVIDINLDPIYIRDYWCRLVD